MKNIVVMNGGRIRAPFDGRFVGTSERETLSVDEGASVSFAPGDGDTVVLPETSSEYDVSASGNRIVLESDDTRAALSVNGGFRVSFADGSAGAGVRITDEGVPRPVLGGRNASSVGSAGDLELSPPATGNLGEGRVLAVLDGSEQTLAVPFRGEVVGTSAAETIRMREGADVDFASGDGDAVALPRSLDAYDLSASGNVLTISGPDDTRASIALNSDTRLAFADGTATASLDTSGEVLKVRVGGADVSGGAASSAVDLGPGASTGFGSDAGPAAFMPDTLPSDVTGRGDPSTPPELNVRFAFSDDLSNVQKESVRETLHDAWSNWTEHLAPSANGAVIDLRVRFSPDPDKVLADAKALSTSPDGPAGGGDFRGREIRVGEPVRELREGADVNVLSRSLDTDAAQGDVRPGRDDGVMRIRTSMDDLSFGGRAGNRIDAETLFTHEIGHVLGINSMRGSDGRLEAEQDSAMLLDTVLDFRDGDLVAETPSGDVEMFGFGNGKFDPTHLENPTALMSPSTNEGVERDVGDDEIALLDAIGAPVSPGTDAGSADLAA